MIGWQEDASQNCVSWSNLRHTENQGKHRISNGQKGNQGGSCEASLHDTSRIEASFNSKP